MSGELLICPSCGWGAATSDGYCLECATPDDRTDDCRWCDAELNAWCGCPDCDEDDPV